MLLPIILGISCCLNVALGLVRVPITKAPLTRLSSSSAPRPYLKNLGSEVPLVDFMNAQ